jgi:phage-related protein
MSQEDLFARVIEGLQNMEAGSERAALAQDLLGRSSQEMAVLLNTSAEDTQAMKDRVNELGGVLSEEAVKNSAAFKDALQDLGTSFSGLTNGAMAEFLPCVTEIMAGITNLFSGDAEGGIGMIVSGLGSLGETILTVVPQLMETGATIITAIVDGIVQYLPTMIDTGFTMLGEFATGFLNNLPAMIDNVSTVLNGAVQWIMQNYPTFLQKGVEVLGKVAQGVIQNLPAIVGAVARMVASFLATVTQNLPSFLAKGIEILGKVVAGIIQSIPSIVSAAGDAVRQAASAFTSYDWGSIGTNIISGIKNGISNSAGRIADAARDAAKSAFEAAKNFLGIESPSKLFRDEVGRYISEGIAVGIEQDDSPSKAIEKSVKSTLRHAQTVNIDGISASGNTSNSADRILAILERYLPECAETDVYLGDKLVSEVNRSLGMKARFA